MAEIEELGMTVVAYHGTNRPDFARFDIAVSGIFNIGLHFEGLTRKVRRVLGSDLSGESHGPIG